MNDFVLRKGDIEKVTGLTERSVRKMESQGKFPKRFIINPGGRAVGWSSREVEEWFSGRVISTRKSS